MAELKTGVTPSPIFLSSPEPLGMLLNRYKDTSGTKSSGDDSEGDFPKTSRGKILDLVSQQRNNEAGWNAYRTNFMNEAINSPDKDVFISENSAEYSKRWNEYQSTDIKLKANIPQLESGFKNMEAHDKKIRGEGVNDKTPIYTPDGRRTVFNYGQYYQAQMDTGMDTPFEPYNPPDINLLNSTWNTITSGLGKESLKGSQKTIELIGGMQQTQTVLNSYLGRNSKGQVVDISSSNSPALEHAYNAFVSDIQNNQNLLYAFNVKRNQYIDAKLSDERNTLTEEQLDREFQAKFKANKIGSKLDQVIAGTSNVYDFVKGENAVKKKAKEDALRSNFPLDVLMGQGDFWTKTTSTIFDLMDRTKTLDFDTAFNNITGDFVGKEDIKKASSFYQMANASDEEKYAMAQGMSEEDLKGYNDFYDIYEEDQEKAASLEGRMRAAGSSEKDIEKMRKAHGFNSILYYSATLMDDEAVETYLLDNYGVEWDENFYDNTIEEEIQGLSGSLMSNVIPVPDAIKNKAMLPSIANFGAKNLLRYGALVNFTRYPDEEWEDSYNKDVKMDGSHMLLLGSKMVAKTYKGSKGKHYPMIAIGADMATAFAPLGEGKDGIMPAITGDVIIDWEATENVMLKIYDPKTGKNDKEITLREAYERWGDELGWQDTGEDKGFAYWDANVGIPVEQGNHKLERTLRSAGMLQGNNTDGYSSTRVLVFKPTFEWFFAGADVIRNQGYTRDKGLDVGTDILKNGRPGSSPVMTPVE